jgi:hypothetical protein
MLRFPVQSIALGLFCGAVCASVTQAADELVPLLRRVPADANVLLAVDIQGVLDSPLAVGEGWRERLDEDHESRPMLLPPKGLRLVRAASFDLHAAKTAWQVALVDFSDAPSLKDLAEREPGHLDTIANAEAFWCPRLGAYLVAAGADTLGAMFPANRQHVGRWLKQRGGQISAYLSGAAEELNGSGPQLVLAIDLDEAFEVENVRESLEAADLGTTIDADAIAPIVASARGATLAITLADGASGTLTIEFAKDAKPLAPIAKPLVLEALARAGATLDDLEDWEAQVSGRKLSMSGELSRGALMRLGTVFELPSLPLDDSGRDEDTADAGDPKVYASQGHFKSVQRLVDNLFDMRGAKTMGQKAMWFESYAKKIDALPLLNVDAELQDYSAHVAGLLRQAATDMKGATIRSGVRQSEASAANVGDDYYSGYDYDGSRQKFQDRRTVRAQERGNAAVTAAEVERVIAEESTAIRRTMTERYKVEF